jgi:hypothetical protein
MKIFLICRFAAFFLPFLPFCRCRFFVKKHYENFFNLPFCRYLKKNGDYPGS